MIYIRGGYGNPDDYDSTLAEKLKAILDELSEEDTHTENRTQQNAVK